MSRGDEARDEVQDAPLGTVDASIADERRSRRRGTIVRAVVVGALASALVIAVWAVQEREAAAETVVLLPDDAPLVAMGEAVYAANCASCHGANLEGQTPDWRVPGPDGRLPAPPHDETGHTWHHDGDTLFRLTKYGLAELLGPDSDYESAMPAYDGVLTDEEILAVLSYIKSTWPADVRERHDAMEASQ